jgi:hypothetical protein
MTNFVETKQTQGECHEDYTTSEFLCHVDQDCLIKQNTVNNWNGLYMFADMIKHSNQMR